MIMKDAKRQFLNRINTYATQLIIGWTATQHLWHAALVIWHRKAGTVARSIKPEYLEGGDQEGILIFWSSINEKEMTQTWLMNLHNIYNNEPHLISKTQLLCILCNLTQLTQRWIHSNIVMCLHITTVRTVFSHKTHNRLLHSKWCRAVTRLHSDNIQETIHRAKGWLSRSTHDGLLAILPNQNI